MLAPKYSKRWNLRNVGPQVQQTMEFRPQVQQTMECKECWHPAKAVPLIFSPPSTASRHMSLLTGQFGPQVQQALLYLRAKSIYRFGPQVQQALLYFRGAPQVTLYTTPGMFRDGKSRDIPLFLCPVVPGQTFGISRDF